MKTLEQILNQEPVYFHNWKCKIDLLSDFEDIYMYSSDYYAEELPPHIRKECWLENKTKINQALEKYKDVNILFASYCIANYSGDAWVLFEQDKKLFEVNGRHCSYCGLEGQFRPEETSLEMLEFRLNKGRLGQGDYSDNRFKEDLCNFLGIELIR